MSYNDKAHYVAEIFLKNRLDALLKPIVGKLLGRYAPLIVANDNMMRRYEQAIKQNMASAEKDLTTAEDKRGFVIGAVLRLWEAYHRDHQIDESQFDRLIGVLAGFSNGEYKVFIQEQVTDYKSGNPPTIIGY